MFANVFAGSREEGAVILELLADLDALLNTNKDFLLGVWVKQAREAASSRQVISGYLGEAGSRDRLQ